VPRWSETELDFLGAGQAHGRLVGHISLAHDGGRDVPNRAVRLEGDFEVLDCNAVSLETIGEHLGGSFRIGGLRTRRHEEGADEEQRGCTSS
jgi:hypothetical protein